MVPDNDASSDQHGRKHSDTGFRGTIVAYRFQIALVGAVVLGAFLRLLPLALTFPLAVPLGGGGLYTEIS
jgi:F0F1-type ATP synthase assembly protein I